MRARQWLTVLVVLSGGCARTRPWQRADLARPEMQAEGDPESRALRDHALSTREGAIGGNGRGGGGCGCN